MELLQKLDEKKRREIVRFLDSHRHDATVDSLKEMQWTAEAMELMVDADFFKNKKANDAAKKQVVMAMYRDMAKMSSNGFKGTFNIGQAIEFVWDTSQGRFGIKLRKKGFLKSCLPCCYSCACVYDVDDKDLSVEVDPIVDVDEEPPQSSERDGGENESKQETDA